MVGLDWETVGRGPWGRAEGDIARGKGTRDGAGAQPSGWGWGGGRSESAWWREQDAEGLAEQGLVWTRHFHSGKPYKWSKNLSVQQNFHFSFHLTRAEFVSLEVLLKLPWKGGSGPGS